MAQHVDFSKNPNYYQSIKFEVDRFLHYGKVKTARTAVKKWHKQKLITQDERNTLEQYIDRWEIEKDAEKKNPQFTRESLNAMTSDQILKLWDSHFPGAAPGRQEAIEMLLSLRKELPKGESKGLKELKQREKNPQKIDEKRVRDNFFKAREIALSIGAGLMRRASADSDEPFFGGNFEGEPVILWHGEDNLLARKIGIVKHGIIELGGRQYYFKRV